LSPLPRLSKLHILANSWENQRDAFPDTSGYYAISAADACHEAFKRRYRACRSTFQAVLQAVGLGIGIDFGACHIVQVPGGLTVLGPRVVYACRLGGAPANTTLLNQPSYEVISERHDKLVLLDETTIDIKHEGGLGLLRRHPSTSGIRAGSTSVDDISWS